MDRTIQVDGKPVRLRSSAAIPPLYRLKFHRDILQDMAIIQKAIKQSLPKAQVVSTPDTTFQGEQAADSAAAEVVVPIPVEALELFEHVAYLMAKHADPDHVPEDINAWLDQFETFSIYRIFPVIMDMWSGNLRTLNRPKKKSRRRKGR